MQSRSMSHFNPRVFAKFSWQVFFIAPSVCPLTPSSSKCFWRSEWFVTNFRIFIFAPAKISRTSLVIRVAVSVSLVNPRKRSTKSWLIMSCKAARNFCSLSSRSFRITTCNINRLHVNPITARVNLKVFILSSSSSRQIQSSVGKNHSA